MSILFQPIIHYHSKENKKNAPLALKDFLSTKRDYFSEKYVISIIKSSNFFCKQDLSLNTNQANSEPDIKNNKNPSEIYEIKTFWNQKGCEELSLDEDFVKTYNDLNFNEDLDYQFENWDKPEKYNKYTQNLIKKMRKKPMNYILFMINTFCIDNDSIMMNTSVDIDAKKWQYILLSNNFKFCIYIIKPTLFNKFVIYKIKQESIEFNFVENQDFFTNYVTIESLTI
jgi:hypothetical protein